jgi:hypothetical protein
VQFQAGSRVGESGNREAWEKFWFSIDNFYWFDFITMARPACKKSVCGADESYKKSTPILYKE